MIDFWKLEHFYIKRIWCFFVGHQEKWRNTPYYYEVHEWCDRCFIDYPSDTTTIPDLLNHLYGWIVEREWAWWERFDMWLIKHHGKKLPSWWEY